MTVIPTNVLAGPFTSTYKESGGSAASIGIIGPEGIRFTRSLSGEPITSDQYGRETILDGIYTGGNLYLEFTLQEVNLASVKKMAHAFSGAPGGATNTLFGVENEMGVPGQLWSATAGELVLTPVAGTPAYAETTPVRTFSQIMPAMGHTLDMFLRSGLKSIPMRMICLPYVSSSKTVWFTLSAHG